VGFGVEISGAPTRNAVQKNAESATAIGAAPAFTCIVTDGSIGSRGNSTGPAFAHAAIHPLSVVAPPTFFSSFAQVDSRLFGIVRTTSASKRCLH
jgi:hypothetical protein